VQVAGVLIHHASWGYQMTPWEVWDYDGVNENVLADLSIDGKPAKALVRFDRNDFTYILDRTNGTLLSAEPCVFVNWATGIDKKTGRPIENPEKRAYQAADLKYICPNSMGGKGQQPSAYSPKTGISYVPTRGGIIC
jgi:lanthanide-dependent methanol dehydrogenase